MGNERAFREGRQFSSYEYTTVSQRVAINGVTGKMIEKKADFADPRNSLPAHSETSDVYFYPGRDGLAEKGKIYKNHSMSMDIDWSHTHVNKGKDGEVFPKGTVHVQEYEMARVRKGGKWTHEFKRVKKARKMTQSEIEKYGPIIHHFNPTVKF